jgi:hypothetical protein
LTSSSITTTSATVSWAAVTGALSYKIDYKAASSSTWITNLPSQSATSVGLTGLVAGTVYDWRVQATCSAGSGSFATAQFTTGSTSCQSAYDTSTNGTISGAATIPLNADIRGRISPKGDVDNYKFVISSGGTITLTLGTLPADYDLKLLNSGGTQVAISQLSGTSAETINFTANAGTYYAQVYGYRSANNSTTCYTLRVATGTAAKAADEELLTTKHEAIHSTKSSAEKIGPAVTVYPNPVRENLRINLSGMEGVAEIGVYTVEGVRVITQRTGSKQLDMDLSSLPSGVYWVKVFNGRMQVSHVKVMKL